MTPDEPGRAEGPEFNPTEEAVDLLSRRHSRSDRRPQLGAFPVTAPEPIEAPTDACVERAHWYYDMPMPLVGDIVRTLRD